MKLSLPSAESTLNGLCLLILGGLGFALIYVHTDDGNRQLLSAIIGGITGWMASGGNHKIADKITNSAGPDATIQPDAEPKP